MRSRFRYKNIILKMNKAFYALGLLCLVSLTVTSLYSANKVIFNSSVTIKKEIYKQY